MAKRATNRLQKRDSQKDMSFSKRRPKKVSRRTNALSIYTQTNQLKRQIEKLLVQITGYRERIEDTEIHINLLTRLITTLCVEKLGMRIGVLKRLLKRIEKEAIRDSQILHLESLYNLPHQHQKKAPPAVKPPKEDPWEDIS